MNVLAQEIEGEAAPGFLPPPSKQTITSLELLISLMLLARKMQAPECPPKAHLDHRKLHIKFSIILVFLNVYT